MTANCDKKTVIVSFIFLDSTAKQDHPKVTTGLVRLFNINTDPTESDNLASRKKQLVKKLLLKLAQSQAASEAHWFPPLSSQYGPIQDPTTGVYIIAPYL